MALSYRMLQIGGQPAGLLGLEELFSALYDEGLTPNHPEIRDRLLNGVKQNNFIPKPAKEEYTNALTMEFQRYYQRRRTGKAIVARRETKGLFTSRQELLDVPRFSKKTFEQAAGFLRIPGGANPLDARNFLGYFDGVYYTPSVGAVVESIIEYDDKEYLVVPNIYRNSEGQVAAVALE